jgi:hypothetical protein
MQPKQMITDMQDDLKINRPQEASFELLIHIALETGKMRFSDFLRLSNEQAQRISPYVELTGERGND